MQDTTTTAPVAAKKKQHTMTANEGTKAKIMELAREFHGYNVSDPEKKKFLTSEEVLDVLYVVATDRRHKVNYVYDEAGEAVFDEDGQPVTETIDLIEVEAKRIIAERDAGRAANTVSTLSAKLAAAETALLALGWTKEGGVLTPPAA